MPRTKQPRKAKSIDASEEAGMLLKDFDKHVRLRMHKMQLEIEQRLEAADMHYGLATSRFPPSLLELTLRELLHIVMNKENCEDDRCEVSSSVEDKSISPAPRTVKNKRASKRTTTTSDDGYITESGTTSSTTTHTSMAAPTTSSKPRQIRTRSSSRSRMTQLSEVVPLKTLKKTERVFATASKNKFKTPALKTHTNEYALVTPKIKPNTPLSVMRRPRQGEMALSMQGSPLLVTSVVNENVANVNVPLENGRVLSLLPNDGLRLSYLPEFDAETRRQLLTLKQHLDKVIGS